ncbi:HD domain-containing phosphohydrolase [Trebonia sp.]|uniref:HD-GYP domain-containing protein n=1 Tax=Trebonia sp. TaxID=2767075 RepID=UPI002613B1EF|nr:HD domain-containing phosphohydrolase [Trebonia sp.]
MSVASPRHEPRGFPRQVLDSGQSLLVLFAGVLLIAAVAQTAAVGVRDVRAALAFGGLIAFGELLRLNLPGDREAAPIATAGALAYALLIRIGNSPVRLDPEQVIAVSAIGMIIGALPHVAVGRPTRLSAMAAQLVSVACVAAVFRPLANASLIGSRWWSELPVMFSLVIVGWLVKAVIVALIRTDALRARFGVMLLDEFRVQLPVGAAVGASALLIAFAAEVMGLAAVAVFTAPLLVTQVALRRYTGIRATYLQTVRALARVTEIGGYVEIGHSARVAKLAVSIGRELGMPEPALLELEYAALMHDIGQLSLREPIPGGATVLVVREEQRRIAEYGAEVIQQARVLDTVADIVRRQSDPCRPGDRGEEPPLSSRIIRAANAFDDLVGSSVEPSRAAAAVQRLRLDTASEYDPHVIEALSRLVSRRSVLGP